MRFEAAWRSWRLVWWGGGVLTAIGLLASALALAPRVAHEAKDRGPVELTMDWAALRAVARSEWDQDPAAVLRELAAAGLTSVAVAEQSVGQLVDAGQALALSDGQLRLLEGYLGRGGTPPGVSGSASRGTGEPVAGLSTVAGTWLLRPGSEPLLLPEPLPEALGLGAGLPDEALAAARGAGLPVLLRYSDRRRAVPWLVEAPPEHGPGVEGPTGAPALSLAGVRTSRVVIFEGSAVPDPASTAEPMKQRGFAVGLVEFASQQGAGELARRLGLAAVGVHSMKAEEMASTTVEAAVARYLRAVRERGVRVLYLRPAETPEQTVALVQGLSAALRQEGFATGLARPHGVLPAPSPALLLLMALGASGLAAWGWVAWVGRRGPLGPVSTLTVAAVLGALGGVAMAWGRARGWDAPASVVLRQMGALAVSLVAPVAAAGATVAASGGPAAGRGTLWRAARGLLAFVAVSTAGGLLVAGLLSDSLFMLRLEQFRGVKLAHALPPAAVAVGALAVGGVGLAQGLDWARRPVRWLDAMAAALLLAAAAYYVVRTGNEAGAVPELERLARGWLEQAMSVRPRTKEFLIAFPALAAALCLYGHGMERRWPLLFAGLMAAAAIGSVSIVNSFAHIHTPLLITLRRELNGLALGLVTGAAAWAVASWLLQRAGMPHEGVGREGRSVGVLRVR